MSNENMLDAERPAFEAAIIAYWQGLHNEPLSENAREFLIRRRATGEYFQFEREWQGWKLPRAAAQVGANGAEEIPIGVCWSETRCDFYAAAHGAGMGSAFYEKWRERCDDFPDRVTALAAIADLAAGAPAAPQHPRLTDEVMSGVAQKLEAAGFSRVSGAPAETPKPITKEWCETMAAREIEFDGNIEAGVETPKPDALARMAHDFPALQAFHTKHALGPMLAPSCLCCGQQTHPLTRPVAIKHGELPGIVVCAVCRDAAATPSATIGAGEGKDALTDEQIMATIYPLFMEIDGGYACDLFGEKVIAAVRAAMRSKTPQ